MTNDKIELLDHGYAELIETWGSDEGIIEAARMSTNKGFKGWGPLHGDECIIDTNEGPQPDCTCSFDTPGDEKLLRYLYENKHSTPFEMAGLTIEVKAPIITFRQWHRHRTQAYNEMSARYTPMPAVDYVPTLARLLGQSGITVIKNKQAGTVAGAGELTPERAEKFRQELADYQAIGQHHYERALEDGVPKELARLFVTVGRYSRMRASANLRNWLAFLTLRMDSHAQEEIRVYAEAVGGFISTKFPRTYDLFVEGSS